MEALSPATNATRQPQASATHVPAPCRVPDAFAGPVYVRMPNSSVAASALEALRGDDGAGIRAALHKRCRVSASLWNSSCTHAQVYNTQGSQWQCETRARLKHCDHRHAHSSTRRGVCAATHSMLCPIHHRFQRFATGTAITGVRLSAWKRGLQRSRHGRRQRQLRPKILVQGRELDPGTHTDHRPSGCEHTHARTHGHGANGQLGVRRTGSHLIASLQGHCRCGRSGGSA